MSKKNTLADEPQENDLELTDHLHQVQLRSSSIIQDLIIKNKLLRDEFLQFQQGCSTSDEISLQKEIVSLQNTIKKLTQQHDEISVNIHELNRSVQSAPKLFCAIQRRVSLTNSSQETTENTECCCTETSELHHLQRQMMFLNEEIGEYEEHQLNLKQENDRLLQENQTLNAQIAKLTLEKEKDQQQVKAQLYALELWENKYRELQTEHESEMEQLKNFYEGLQNSLLEERAKVQQLQAANEDLYKNALNGKNQLKVETYQAIQTQQSPPKSFTLTVPVVPIDQEKVNHHHDTELQYLNHETTGDQQDNFIDIEIKRLKKVVLGDDTLKVQLNKDLEDVSVSRFRHPLPVVEDPADICLDPLPHQKIEENMKKRVLPGKINPLFLLKLTQKIVHSPSKSAEKPQSDVQLLERPVPKQHKPRRSLLPEFDLQ